MNEAISMPDMLLLSENQTNKIQKINTISVAFKTGNLNYELRLNLLCRIISFLVL